MDLFDFQTTLTVAVILTATAAVVFFDYLRRRRRTQQPQPIKAAKLVRPQRVTPIFDAPALDYLPAKKVVAERPKPPADSLVAVATPSRPPVEPRIERDTVTIEMAPPSPSAPSGQAGTPAQAETSSPARVALHDFKLPPVTIDAALWERLISSQPKHNLLSSAEADPEPAGKTPPPPRFSNTIEANYKMIQENHAPVAPAENQPGGMIQQSTLEKWLETEKTFTGLVVSISINDCDSSMGHSRGLMQSVGNYIAGLLRAKDYYCRTGYDEFLIVCPGELGAQSQRRLNHISERLWDYQLRGMGACSILFSWGGVQVENQPLAEAVASATERMRETKRTSKLAVAHRQAV